MTARSLHPAASRPLLYVDMLGMKQRWRAEGVPGARRAFDAFYGMVAAAVDAQGTDLAVAVTGGVQSDAAAVVLPSIDSALAVGRTLFRAAFASMSADERTWLRGVIIGMPPTEPIEAVSGLAGSLTALIHRRFSDDLLRAIYVEQSGFRGHRLLVTESLIDEDLVAAQRIAVEGRTFHPLRRLDLSHAPDGFRDLLWMYPRSAEEGSWDDMRLAMRNRFRWAAGASEGEFIQAAATRLVFDECQAIVAGRRSENSANH